MNPRPMSDHPTSVSRSSLRALEIFDAFRAARRPLSLSELARITEIPVSTCHGVLRALEQRGFLYHVGGARDVYPTRRLWDLADELRAHDPVARRLEPGLVALRDETDETVILGARQGDAVLYLLVLESSQAIRYSSRAGECKPLHASAIGKVMLGAMAPLELDAFLAPGDLPRVTKYTIVEPHALRRDLDAARARGWSVTRGENVADVMAVAAPVRIGGRTLGVAIAGPIHRMQSAEQALAGRLTDCIRTLENADVG